MKQYRVENKEKIKETSKIYEETHKEQISAYRKQYSKEWRARKKLETQNGDIKSEINIQ